MNRLEAWTTADGVVKELIQDHPLKDIRSGPVFNADVVTAAAQRIELTMTVAEWLANPSSADTDEWSPEESNLVIHAKRELALSNEDPWMAQGIIEMVTVFAQMGHSGGSAGAMLSILNELLQFHNLTPLTNNPDEWMHIADDRTNNESVWQNCRRHDAFSNDGGRTFYLVDDRETVYDSSREYVPEG